jgi:hypothetical protein
MPYTIFIVAFVLMISTLFISQPYVRIIFDHTCVELSASFIVVGTLQKE